VLLYHKNLTTVEASFLSHIQAGPWAREKKIEKNEEEEDEE